MAEKDIDHGDIMECLVNNKNVQGMDKKCKSYVHHYELISLRDYHFNFKFIKHCQDDIEKYCVKGGQEKY